MKRTLIIITILIFSMNVFGQSQTPSVKPEQTIFAFGGDINSKFVQYIVDLTNKKNPKVCFLPTASTDNEENIKYWNSVCKKLSIEPYVLKVWISSASAPKTFEEILLDMDAIVVGGGNTLNMMAIWKAQGIDIALEKALKKGIILSGGSAGSICWYQKGVSDSRPINLSMVDGLAFLPYSSCPHYADSLKKVTYHQLIRNKEIISGYACDDLSGVVFKNGKFIKAISLNDINNSYYVTLKNGIIQSQRLDSEILINKDAIQVTDYIITEVNKAVKDFPEIYKQDTPLNAYVSIMHLFANGQDSKYKQVASHSLQERLGETPDTKVDENKKNNILNGRICKILVYNDSVAGVINEHKDFYGLWYFYKENGKWMSAGEDMGGDTKFEAEIIFREKAQIHMDKLKNVNNSTI